MVITIQRGRNHVLRRAGGEGGNDLYVSRRHYPNDDEAWSAPVNLGAAVNTKENEQAPNYHQNAEEGRANLYFNRGLASANKADLYYTAVSRAGTALGPAVSVSELNTSDSSEQAASLRQDAKEVFFFSNRAGGQAVTTFGRPRVRTQRIRGLRPSIRPR